MKKRPTIPDLAAAAGVSVSTVNRVIGNPQSVRAATRERVILAARDIGFYGFDTAPVTPREIPSHRLGILLLQSGRRFYVKLAEALRRAAQTYADADVHLTVEYLETLDPEHVVDRLRAMARSNQSIGLVTAEHPTITEAVEEILERGLPVTGLISPLSARGNVGYIGLDNWKVGRTAAWTFDRMIRSPGKIGVLLGDHRYRSQEMAESGFRSYFREHNDAFTLLVPQATHESAAIAEDRTARLLRDHPDLCGLFIAGGGISGAISALRAAPRRPDFVAIGRELFDATRLALIDGTLTMVISHPLDHFARETVNTMARMVRAGPEAGAPNLQLGFEIYTSENV